MLPVRGIDRELPIGLLSVGRRVIPKRAVWRQGVIRNHLIVASLLVVGACSSTGLKPGEGQIDVPGGRVWYRLVGSGRATPLLLVHGGPGRPVTTLRGWRHLPMSVLSSSMTSWVAAARITRPIRLCRGSSGSSKSCGRSGVNFVSTRSTFSVIPGALCSQWTTVDPTHRCPECRARWAGTEYSAVYSGCAGAPSGASARCAGDAQSP